MQNHWLKLIVAVPLLFGFVGCLPSPVAKQGGTGHDHADEHAHGPHGGHVVELGNEEYHAEWNHEDDGRITIYVLDSSGKKEFPITAEKVSIDVTIKKKNKEQKTTYELLAKNRTEGENPTATLFEIVDKQLLVALEALSPGGIEATLNININGKDFSVELKHDPHHHH